MTDVLFTHSYFYRLDAKQWRFRQPYPPYGTLLAAAVIREAGFSVALHDSALTSGPSEFGASLAVHRPHFVVIYDDGFNYLTKMCLTVMRDAAFRMAADARNAGSIVIVCSSDSTDHYDQYLAQGADFVIRGEGEDTLKEFLTRMRGGLGISDIPGLAFVNDGEIVTTGTRPVLRNLDQLPLPAWDLVDIESYRHVWMKHHGYFSLNLATTRGCPYKCNWCAKPIYGNRYNSRTPEHVVREIDLIMDRFKPDHFWMSDDIFGLKPGWVREFASQVKAAGLKFTYKIQSRVDLLQEETVAALAASGGETVWVGAESGSQKILDAMDKGTTLAEIRQARALLHRYGINTAFFLQFGYPGETKQDIQATIDMVLDLMPEEIGISVSYPLPGTKFYENVKAGLKEKQNWSNSDDLALMFQGPYPPAFYRVLHRYVHSRYRIQRGIKLFKSIFKTRGLPARSGFKTFASMIYHTPSTFFHAYRLKKFEPNVAGQ